MLFVSRGSSRFQKEVRVGGAFAPSNNEVVASPSWAKVVF